MYNLELFHGFVRPTFGEHVKEHTHLISETGNCLQQVKGSWHRLSGVHKDISIFTSSALKTWVLHVNTFYSWILLYISPWQPLTYLCFPYCIALIYFSFTKIRMFLYARNYWLAEFILSDNFKSDTLFKSDETLCPTWEYDRWYTWRDLYIFYWKLINTLSHISFI